MSRADRLSRSPRTPAIKMFRHGRETAGRSTSTPNVGWAWIYGESLRAAAPPCVSRGRAAGLLGIESADGKSLVYQPRDGESPLLALSLTGGPTRQLVKCAKPTAFSVASQSLYYVECGSDPNPAVHVMDPSTGRDRLLGRLERFSSSYCPMGLSVSPDGTTILYNKVVNDGADLMLIENFR